MNSLIIEKFQQTRALATYLPGRYYIGILGYIVILHCPFVTACHQCRRHSAVTARHCKP